MSRADAILRKFVDVHFDAVTDSAALEPHKATLQSELRAQIQSDAAAFWICVAMVLALYVGAFLLVLGNLHQPKVIEGIFAVTGVSMTALIRQMVSLWRERSRLQVIRALADSVPAADLKEIILSLLKNE
jgi:hypothetical protein